MQSLTENHHVNVENTNMRTSKKLSELLQVFFYKISLSHFLICLFLTDFQAKLTYGHRITAKLNLNKKNKPEMILIQNISSAFLQVFFNVEHMSSIENTSSYFTNLNNQDSLPNNWFRIVDCQRQTIRLKKKTFLELISFASVENKIV